MCRVALVCFASLLPAISFGQSSLFSGASSSASRSGMSSTGGSSSSSLFGSTGSGSTGQSSGLQSGLQSTGTAGTTTGSTGTTGTGTSSSSGTVGSAPTPGVGQMSGQQILGANNIGRNSFTGRAAPGNFIGVSATTQQANLNAFNQIFQGLQRNGGGNGRGSNQASPERFQLRPTLRVGFDHSPITASASVTSPRFEKRFAGITERRPQLAGVNIASDYEGRVVLRGTVASEDSKKLAAALMRLEPGVRDVVNEITVEPPTASE